MGRAGRVAGEEGRQRFRWLSQVDRGDREEDDGDDDACHDEDEREDAEHDTAAGEQREEPLFGRRELAAVEGGVDGSLAA